MTTILAEDGLHALIEVLQSRVNLGNRKIDLSGDPFVFAVDHCFSIRGVGTIATGVYSSELLAPSLLPLLFLHPRLDALPRD